jgi:hypothetical protein
MKAFICVYQHPNPSPGSWKRTAVAAGTDPHLAEFLRRYYDDDTFYDWGDDPGFFAATRLLGDPAMASWGVCRPDVRRQLSPGDFIVWICARSKREGHGAIDYFFVGVTTVRDVVDRVELWRKTEYSKYRAFYNVLTALDNGKLVQHETFHDFHDNWEHRASRPYIIFDASRNVSRLELTKPVHIAHRHPGELQEDWLSDSNPRASAIEKAMLLDIGCRRRLRIRSVMNAHRHIAIHAVCPADADLIRLRARLIELV